MCYVDKAETFSGEILRRRTVIAFNKMFGIAHVLQYVFPLQPWPIHGGLEV